MSAETQRRSAPLPVRITRGTGGDTEPQVARRIKFDAGPRQAIVPLLLELLWVPTQDRAGEDRGDVAAAMGWFQY